jgi:hypothetical protein
MAAGQYPYHAPAPRLGGLTPPHGQQVTNDIPPQRSRDRRKVIHASCSVHTGAVGFTNLVVSQYGGEIELNPHVDGSCKLTLSEDAACARCATH